MCCCYLVKKIQVFNQGKRKTKCHKILAVNQLIMFQIWAIILEILYQNVLTKELH